MLPLLCIAVGILPVGVVLRLRHLQACRPDPPGGILLHTTRQVPALGEMDGSGEQASC
jgi:hypothetical protein